jgi:ssDNA-binding protein
MPLANDQFKLEKVRLSFPDIWKARAVQEGGEPRYSAAFLIDKKSQEEQLVRLKTAIWTAAKTQWGDKAKELIQSKGKGKILVCLHEGSDKEYDGYDESNMYISTSSSRRPMIVDQDKNALAEDDRRPYAGCYVNAIVRLWCQQNNFGNRVNAELMGIQFHSDGEPFGAAPLSEDAFDDISDKDKKSGKKGKAETEPDPDEDEIPF